MPNLGEAVKRFEADEREFVTWVALHEVTHAVQFSGVPWAAVTHLAGLIRELMDRRGGAHGRRTAAALWPSRATLARVGRALFSGPTS